MIDEIYMLLDVSEVIRPMKVRSPVIITTPAPDPSTTSVLRKTKFLLSIGSMCVNAVVLNCGFDSPVTDELSTFYHFNVLRKNFLIRC